MLSQLKTISLFVLWMSLSMNFMVQISKLDLRLGYHQVLIDPLVTLIHLEFLSTWPKPTSPPTWKNPPIH